MAAILGLTARHVAGQAVARAGRMGSSECTRMTIETAFTKVHSGAGGLRMWIMARAAPHSSLALTGTAAARQLFGMAYHLERAFLDRNINNEDVFKQISRTEIGEALSGIQHTSCTREMTLFADRVAARGRQFCGIDNRARSR